MRVKVTPCVGVWIETNVPLVELARTLRSHPAWVCGLKLWLLLIIQVRLLVTPCVGVWIETFPRLMLLTVLWSHPAWVCGLKLKLNRYWISILSHTLRGCVDWNPILSIVSLRTGVTPCVGVWIETSNRLQLRHWALVTPCVGVWIETRTLPMKDYPVLVTPCVGVWIETVCRTGHAVLCTSHTLRGCVDWNSTHREVIWIVWVTPCVGVWIETMMADMCWRVKWSHTLRGCVDWNDLSALYALDVDVTPCVGVWIETLLTGKWYG